MHHDQAATCPPPALRECLQLLEAADALLLGAGEAMLAAHLSGVTETLRGMIEHPVPATALLDNSITS
jgi:hypothetical protein